VPGGDERISFCALYLDRGRILARFDGRKLRSWPMGHTTVAEPHIDDEVFEQTRRFYAPLALSGPVSLELKRDDEGRLWVIEPTVGRTDFWLGLCLTNGVNLPYVEYRHQAGLDVPEQLQTARRTWLNTDRDPAALPWYLARCLAGAARLRRIAFPYLESDDLQPFRRAMGLALADYSAAVRRKLARATRAGAGQARNGEVIR
jgi:predicted ATP-grasp superfamily ATP-dependent carboligase